MSKIPSSVGKNRSVQRQGSPSSPRAVSAHQRSQYHRPGTSRDRNNPDNTTVHRLVRKHGNLEPCECRRMDSPLRDLVNSDDDADCHLAREHMHSRNICKESELRWHYPPGEPHSEPEMDSPPRNRHREYSESKKRLSGQGESVYDKCRELRAKISIETGSSVDKDVREQCERDQQELKDLYEDVGEFVKRKSAGRIVVDSNEEDDAWDDSKQQREEKDEEANSQDLLESIDQFVGKLPTQRKGNTSRVAARGSKARNKVPMEQPRARCSKLDTRKTYHSVGTDGRIVAGGQQQELGRNLDDELGNVHLKSFDQEEEEKVDEDTKEVEDLSLTEEEARELSRKDNEAEQIHRQLSESWALCKRDSTTWKPRGRTARDLAMDKEAKTYGKPDCGKKLVNAQVRCKGRKEKEAMIGDESEPLRRNYVRSNEAERTESKRTKARDRSRGKEEMVDKMYEEFKNCCGALTAREAGDLEFETSKTKTCIDEMIDNGLSREAKRASGGTLRETVKDLRCEANVSEGGPLKRRTSDEPSKIIHPDGICPVSRSEDNTRATRSDCFCKTLAEIVADHQDPREYVRKLKNCRWAYLNHLQSDLEKLYGLEKFLDSCSPERRPSSATLNMPEKRDRAKGFVTQSRL